MRKRVQREKTWSGVRWDVFPTWKHHLQRVVTLSTESLITKHYSRFVSHKTSVAPLLTRTQSSTGELKNSDTESWPSLSQTNCFSTSVIIYVQSSHCSYYLCALTMRWFHIKWHMQTFKSCFCSVLFFNIRNWSLKMINNYQYNILIKYFVSIYFLAVFLSFCLSDTHSCSQLARPLFCISIHQSCERDEEPVSDIMVYSFMTRDGLAIGQCRLMPQWPPGEAAPLCK